MPVDEPVRVERIGLAYRVRVPGLDAEFVFRDPVLGSSHRADVEVAHAGRHLFRSPSDLSLRGRDQLAKTAAELDSGDGEAWRAATFAAVEAVIAAEEAFDGVVDLRHTDPARGADVVIDPVYPAAATVAVAPNQAGKSTLVRALAVAVASGKAVLPGCRPVRVGPVLYLVGEDPAPDYHARNLAEICRGAGLDLARLSHRIDFYPMRGRSLRQVARAVAERAPDYAALFLDSYQAALGPSDGDLRDRDGSYWNAVDEIGHPLFTIGHPNRADRRTWARADGSLAGSDVGQDRARCAWKVVWEDEPDATLVRSTRRYTLECVKWSHGPRFDPVSFALERTFVQPEGWTFRFRPAEPITTHDEIAAGRPSSVYAATLAAYRAGARTPPELARALGLDYETAKKRLQRYAAQLTEEAGP